MSKDIKTLYCRECGAEVYSNEKKCWNCDTKLKNSMLGYLLLSVLCLALVSVIGYMYLVGYNNMYNKGIAKTTKKYERKIEELNTSHTVELEETYEEGRIYGINQVADEMMEKVKQADWEYYLSVRHSDVLLDAPVQQLNKKFDYDPSAFRRKYGLKVIRATGIVTDVSTITYENGSEEILVHLVDANNSSDILECIVTTLYEDDVTSSAKENKVITIEGTIYCEPPFDDMDSPTSFKLIGGRVTLQ